MGVANIGKWDAASPGIWPDLGVRKTGNRVVRLHGLMLCGKRYSNGSKNVNRLANLAGFFWLFGVQVFISARLGHPAPPVFRKR
jgi:hypothetical protein